MPIKDLPNEKYVIKRFRKGDHVAFTTLYSHYWKPLLLVAWNHTKDKTFAEDIVHEVFMRLWEFRETIDIDNISGFLATGVKFSIFKHYQKEKRREELSELNLSKVSYSDAESYLDARFLSEYLEGLTEKLPEKCRLVFQYSRKDGLKNAEIAKIMGISEKGVEANLTRALKILKKAIDRNYFTLFYAKIHVLCKKILFGIGIMQFHRTPWLETGQDDGTISII